jgi:hypothetical protein
MSIRRFAVPENRGTFEARGARLPRASVLRAPNHDERMLCVLQYTAI